MNVRWRESGLEGSFVRIKGKDGIFVLTKHAGDCFYECENVFNGEQSNVYVSEFDLLPESALENLGRFVGILIGESHEVH
jgi:hypothetical protein